MLERFTSEARLAVRHAQDEARELRDPQIRPEHLLIALARGDGDAGQVLRAHGLEAAGLRHRLLTLSDDVLDAGALAMLGIDLEEVRKATEADLGPGFLDRALAEARRDENGIHLPFSKEGKKVMELAVRETMRLKSGEIASGHLLLGILRAGDGPAVQLLREARLDVATLRAEVTSLMTAKAA